MSDIVHGGQLDKAVAKYGGERSYWLDLSTGINPVAYPVPDIPAKVWQQLPDDNLMEACLVAARKYYRVPEGAEIVAGPGTQAIIQRLGGMRRVIVGPTYGDYADPMDRQLGTVLDVDQLPDRFEAGDTVFVCHPNNPNGRMAVRDMVLNLLDRAASDNGLLVIDEAFADVAPEESFTRFADHPNLVVLRSFGKFFGLAGMRLGFAMGGGLDIGDLVIDLGSWAVPGPALYVGAKALRDEAWITETRTRLGRDARSLRTILIEAGLEIVGGTDLFVLAKTKDAAALREALARQHILIRTFDYDPTWARFGLPAGEEGFERLRNALAAHSAIS